MTPKEKANKLYDRFFNDPIICYDDYYGGNPYGSAKQCALIAVDEIIGSVHIALTIDELEFWQEVRNEIEKL